MITSFLRRVNIRKRKLNMWSTISQSKESIALIRHNKMKNIKVY